MPMVSLKLMAGAARTVCPGSPRCLFTEPSSKRLTRLPERRESRRPRAGESSSSSADMRALVHA